MERCPLGSIGTLLCALEFPPEGSLLGSCGSGKFSFWLHHFVSCTQSTVTLPAVIVLLSAWLMCLFSGTMTVSAVLTICMRINLQPVCRIASLQLNSLRSVCSLSTALQPNSGCLVAWFAELLCNLQLVCRNSSLQLSSLVCLQLSVWLVACLQKCQLAATP